MTDRHRRGRPPHPDLLTPAEWQVLNWVRHGVSRSGIARQRGTTLGAVKYHLANITGKLGVNGSAELRHWPGIPAASALHGREHRDMDSAIGINRLGQVALDVSDVEASVRFYRDTLGLPHLFTFGKLAFLDCGGTRLYLHEKPRDEWRAGSYLYFEVGDIQSAYQALADAGVAFTGAPHLIHTHEDGTEEWMAFFSDPSGNPLALMARVAPQESAGR